MFVGIDCHSEQVTGNREQGIDYVRSLDINANNILLMLSISSHASSDTLTYFKRSDNSNCVLTSNNNPLAIARNLAYSVFDPHPFPSAMFDGIDTTARRS